MRARNIKPGFFVNDDLAELPMSARLLFAGLWCIADREGRLKDKPKVIKAQLFPWDDIDINSLLNDLHNSGFVKRYIVDGAKYLQVINFGKHQNPHKNEAASVIPPFDPSQKTQENQEDEVVQYKHSTSTVQAPEKHSTNRDDSHDSHDSHDSLIEDSLIEDSVIAQSDKNRSTPPPDTQPIFISIILNDKTEFPIYETQVHEWGSLFPRVDVEQELRNICAWNKANPVKRKTKRGILSHITAWLSKEQNKGGTTNAHRPTGTPTGTYQRDYSPWGGNTTRRNGEAVLTPKQEADIEELRREVAEYEAQKAAANGQAPKDAMGNSP